MGTLLLFRQQKYNMAKIMRMEPRGTATLIAIFLPFKSPDIAKELLDNSKPYKGFPVIELCPTITVVRIERLEL